MTDPIPTPQPQNGSKRTSRATYKLREQLKDKIRELEDMVYIAVTGDGLKEVMDNVWYQQIADRGKLRKYPPPPPLKFKRKSRRSSGAETGESR